MRRTLRRVLAVIMALLVSVNTVNLHVFAEDAYSTGSLQEESADNGGISSPENVEEDAESKENVSDGNIAEGSVSSGDTDREAVNKASVSISEWTEYMEYMTKLGKGMPGGIPITKKA